MKAKLLHSITGVLTTRCLIVVLLAGLLTGCVFQRKTVQLTLAPKVDQPLKSSAGLPLAIGNFKDTRLVTDGFVLMQDENAYGLTEGAFVTEKPVAEIFRDGLTAALEQNGFRLTLPAQYELRGDLQSSGISLINGILLPHQIKFWLTARFDLVEPLTGRTVWHDTYTGQDTATHLTMIRAKFIVPACSNMLVNTISQLVLDRNFRGFFEAQSTNKADQKHTE